MIRTVFSAALFTVAMTGLVHAEDKMACDDKSMTMVMESVDKAMGDNKAMAMKEIDMAKAAMKDNKMDDCAMHLEMAEKEAMKM